MRGGSKGGGEEKSIKADPGMIKKAFLWTCNFWVMLFLVVLRGVTERLGGFIPITYSSYCTWDWCAEYQARRVWEQRMWGGCKEGESYHTP